MPATTRHKPPVWDAGAAGGSFDAAEAAERALQPDWVVARAGWRATYALGGQRSSGLGWSSP